MHKDELAEIAMDVCEYLEPTPYYETVAAYFHDRLTQREIPFETVFHGPRLVVNNG